MATPEEQIAATTAEGKFFGVNTTIEDDDPIITENDEQKPEVEIVDDRLPEDRRKAAEDKPAEDDDFETYGKKVQKRIKKLTWQANEERRRREAAEKMNEEAVRVAQQLAQRNRYNEDLIVNGEARLVAEFKGRASLAVKNARAAYSKAHEEGDTDAVIKAQEDMIEANSEWRDAVNYEADYNQRTQRRQPPVQPPVQLPVQPRTVPKPTKEASVWADNNPWFGSNAHRDMTALAYAEHERLVRDEGLTPDSDEYYTAIDKVIQQRFPEYFDDGEILESKPATVVAPATRNNGARTRKIKLTATQAALAPRLGLTLEQYAEQLIKDMQNE